MSEGSAGSDDIYVEYIRGLFSNIREFAAKARTRSMSAPRSPDIDAYYEGALMTILVLMQNKAQLLDLDLKLLGMDNFDPLTDDLDPK